MNIPTDLLRAILDGYTLPLDGIHGLAHWGRVLETGLRLSEETDADPEVVTLFALFHDARRWNESIDPEHGLRGAELAESLRDELPLDDLQFELLAEACIHHTDGLTEAHPTVQTCWDADRLDLWRVGIEPENSLLCTPAARDAGIREWSRIRSLDDHWPEPARAWLRQADGHG